MVPQLDILSQASVFITHAGMGGTGEAIYYGVPMIAIPQMEEQAITARGVQCRYEEPGRRQGFRRGPAALPKALTSYLPSVPVCRGRYFFFAILRLTPGGGFLKYKEDRL